MYNIVISKSNETNYFEDGTGKPRSYSSLADALVSAQYLGLTKKDVELYFVKEGTDIKAVSLTATGIQESYEPVPLSLEKMSKEQLIAYAKTENITVKADSSKEKILAEIKSAAASLVLDIKSSEELEKVKK